MPRHYQPRPIRLEEAASAVSGQICGPGDTLLTGVSSLEGARSGDLTFIDADRFIEVALRSKAAAFVVERQIAEIARPQLIVPNPRYALAVIVERLFTSPRAARGISEHVVRGTDAQIGPEPSIWPFVTLGDRVRIGARVTLYSGVFIGDDAVVGDDSVLHPNVVVMHGCWIGSRVTIHSSTVIGSDGFGYVQHRGRHHKIPQIGTVAIEDDVELGANVTVDRATFGETRIKRGSKVDNLVQVAHNVTIGEDCAVVAQVGIAGSTSLGSRVVVGGQAGVADHVAVGDRVTIAARSGVTRNLARDQVVSGTPAMPHRIALKAYGLLSRLPGLRQQVRNLERRVRALESDASQNGDAKAAGDVGERSL
jgi:UDP-3-O-[3-hydroxymyristoyl] glucosamine N-acyltransferase